MNYLGKKEYLGIGGKRKMSSKLIANLCIMSICFILISVSIWNTNLNSDNLVLTIEQDMRLIHTVSNKFLSFGLDSSLLRKMEDLPIHNERFINLAHHLSPAYVRIGGTSADCLQFVQKMNDVEPIDFEKSSYDRQDISNFTITSDNFLSLYQFSQKAEINMIFDLNVLLRNADNTWNSNNAKEIIQFARSHEMEIDWQIGNEPNSFFHVFNITIPPKQLAKDYCELRAILDNMGYQASLLIGPEANHIGDENHKGAIYIEEFLSHVNNCIDGVTWHQYYLNGHIARVQDFINCKVFNKLSIEINTVKESIKLSGLNVSTWISETSSAYGGGAPELSDRFVAGFLWLDKLGYSARTGIQVIIRQSLLGGDYAMVGSDLNPNPDWWVAVLFKKFVSEKVLDLTIQNNFGNVRAYAHCASQEASYSQKSQIVIYGVNINEDKVRMNIEGPPEGSKILSYILTSDNLRSRKIFMNGEILKLKSDGSLPLMESKVMDINQDIILPKYSMFFFFLQGMKITKCLAL